MKKYANDKKCSNTENYAIMKVIRIHFESIQMCFDSEGMFIRSIGMQHSNVF